MPLVICMLGWSAIVIAYCLYTGYMAWKHPLRYVRFSRKYLFARFSSVSDEFIIVSGKIGSIVLFIFYGAVFFPILYLLILGMR